jgi:p-cumate 2,3-dioxygenase beta subunit
MSLLSQVPARSHTATRLVVEGFLYEEAAYLDAWDLDGWLTLFAQDCRYEVTPTGIDNPWTIDWKTTMFLIGDNRERLEQRIIRLKKSSAHVEFPKSKTRHLYTNVRVIDDTEDEVVAMANCCTFRSKNRVTTHYPGSMRYIFQRRGDSFLIKSKRVALDLEALIPQGKVSIIL